MPGKERNKTRSKSLLTTITVCIVMILAVAGIATFRIPATAGDASEPDTIAEIPDYSGDLVIDVNGGEPFFTEEERNDLTPFESYSDLDALGRCGTAYALITRDTMPEEDREDISSVHPSGWKQEFYNDTHAYERCHLIAFMLAGENDNEKNLITGTHKFNVDGMLPYESQVSQYVNQFNGSVRYRVTPVFEGDNLVAKGVLIEAYSAENPEECTFNVFVYNVSDLFDIDYLTGQTSKITSNNENNRKNFSGNDNRKNFSEENDENRTLFSKSTGIVTEQQGEVQSDNDEVRYYILNAKSHKIHYPWCESVGDIKQKNKLEYTGTIEDLINDGYEPCKRCNP